MQTFIPLAPLYQSVAMTEAPTVEIDGVEFNAEHLEAALDRFTNEDGQINRREGGHGIEKTVAIRGDTYDDGDCHLTPVSNLTSMDVDDGMRVECESDLLWTNTGRLRRAVDEALEEEFSPVEYVEYTVLDINDVLGPNDADRSLSEDLYDVEVRYSHFEASEIDTIMDDPALTLGRITEHHGDVCIGLSVDEDEATE